MELRRVSSTTMPGRRARSIHGLPVVGGLDALERIAGLGGPTKSSSRCRPRTGGVAARLPRRAATRAAFAHMPGVYELLGGPVSVTSCAGSRSPDLLASRPAARPALRTSPIAASRVLSRGADGIIGGKLCPVAMSGIASHLVLATARTHLGAGSEVPELVPRRARSLAVMRDDPPRLATGIGVTSSNLELQTTRCFHAAAPTVPLMVNRSPGEASLQHEVNGAMQARRAAIGRAGLGAW